MLNCLKDFIGLSYCDGDAQPPSGLFLNSLPGISIESIDKIAEAEQAGYLGVWKDVQTSALAQFKIDVLAEIHKCYQINHECDYDALICANKEVLAQALKYCLVVWLLLFRITTSRLNRFTTVDRKQAQELRDYYQTEYDNALKQAVQIIDVTSCELCCGGNPEYVYALP